MALRHQMRDTKIEVVVIIPIAVRMNLGGSLDFTEPIDEFAGDVIKRLSVGKQEATYTFSAKTSQASRKYLDEIFARINPV